MTTGAEWLGSAHWPSFRAFMDERVAIDPKFACPVRVLWRGYGEYCQRWGFEPATAEEFAEWLGSTEGVHIEKRGPGSKGRLHRMAKGLVLLHKQLPGVHYPLRHL